MHGLVLLATLIRGEGGVKSTRSWTGHLSQNMVQCLNYLIIHKLQLVVACLLVNSHSELHTSLDRVQRKSVYSLPFRQAVVSMY